MGFAILPEMVDCPFAKRQKRSSTHPGGEWKRQCFENHLHLGKDPLATVVAYIYISCNISKSYNNIFRALEPRKAPSGME